MAFPRPPNGYFVDHASGCTMPPGVCVDWNDTRKLVAIRSAVEGDVLWEDMCAAVFSTFQHRTALPTTASVSKQILLDACPGFVSAMLRNQDTAKDTGQHPFADWAVGYDCLQQLLSFRAAHILNLPDSKSHPCCKTTHLSFAPESILNDVAWLNDRPASASRSLSIRDAFPDAKSATAPLGISAALLKGMENVTKPEKLHCSTEDCALVLATAQKKQFPLCMGRVEPIPGSNKGGQWTCYGMLPIGNMAQCVGVRDAANVELDLFLTEMNTLAIHAKALTDIARGERIRIYVPSEGLITALLAKTGSAQKLSEDQVKGLTALRQHICSVTQPQQFETIDRLNSLQRQLWNSGGRHT